MTYKILNRRGLVIGLVNADNPQAAVRAFNSTDPRGREVGYEADPAKCTPKTTNAGSGRQGDTRHERS